MQRRLIIVGIVFIVGFGLGYGATWLLVGPPGVVRPDAAPTASAPTAPTTDVAASPNPDAPAEAPSAPTDAPAAAPNPNVEPAEPAPVNAGQPTEQPAAAVPEPAEVPEPAVARGPEGECVGATCRLDFGEVSGGISVRRASLKDGQSVDWDKDFGDAAKIGLIPAGNKVRVEVRGIGYTDGVPTAASVVFRNRSVSLSGVIALVVGDKQLKLVRD